MLIIMSIYFFQLFQKKNKIGFEEFHKILQ